MLKQIMFITKVMLIFSVFLVAPFHSASGSSQCSQVFDVRKDTTRLNDVILTEAKDIGLKAHLMKDELGQTPVLALELLDVSLSSTGEGPMPLSDILDLTGNSRGSSTYSSARRSYDQLIRRGYWVSKDNPNNRRYKDIEITQKGIILLENIFGSKLNLTGIERFYSRSAYILPDINSLQFIMFELLHASLLLSNETKLIPLREILEFTNHEPGFRSYPTTRRAYDALLRNQYWVFTDNPENRREKLVEITDSGREYLDGLSTIFSESLSH